MSVSQGSPVKPNGSVNDLIGTRYSKLLAGSSYRVDLPQGPRTLMMTSLFVARWVIEVHLIINTYTQRTQRMHLNGQPATAAPLWPEKGADSWWSRLH